MLINVAILEAQSQKQDSLLNISPVSDSLKKGAAQFKTELRSDTLKKQFLSNKMRSTSGVLNLGYDYGIIPFAAKQDFPLGYYKADGNVSLTLLNIPITATFLYSSIKNVSGLNNYFRLSYDAPTFAENLNKKKVEALEADKKKLSELSEQKRLLQQQINYAGMLRADLPGNVTQTPSFSSAFNTPSVPSYTVPDTSHLMNQVPQSFIATSIKEQLDSIQKVRKYKYQADSLDRVIGQVNRQLEGLNQQIDALDKKVKYIENSQKFVDEDPYISRFNQFMMGMKKFEVGLCYPNYSTFLINGSAVKGINVEWEKKVYFAFTYGKTINTVLTTNNIIQNQLQTGQNLYNFFDFNNVKDTRKLLSVKFGIGKKDDTHIYLGLLYGTGLNSYIADPTQASIEKNVVAELDARYRINTSNSFDLVYGKSAIYQNTTAEGMDDRASKSLFSNVRSNALLARYTLQLTKTGTKITAMSRLTDPFFKSYGIGFMRSDNLRYELKVEQALGSRVKFSGFYRRDRDNLLDYFLYTTSLQTFGANLSVKVTRRLTVRAMFSPVVQQVGSKDDSYQMHKVNNIYNAIATYNGKFGKISSLFNAVYSYYQLGKATPVNNYQNCSLSNNTQWSSVFRTNLSANWFFNNTGDSLNSKTFMVAAEGAISAAKNFAFSLGGKYAYNNWTHPQLGGTCKINWTANKHLVFEALAERLVLGDFYNSYNNEQIKKFPYYGYGKVSVLW